MASYLECGSVRSEVRRLLTSNSEAILLVDYERHYFFAKLLYFSNQTCSEVIHVLIPTTSVGVIRIPLDKLLFYVFLTV